MLVNVKFSVEPFNAAVRKGTAGATIQQILDEIKPESAFFTDHEGQRSATLVVQVKDSVDIPRFAEPWYLQFDAQVEFHIAMTPDDLAKADLGALGKKWS